MSTYRAADGFDVALGSLSELDPQPSSEGIQYARTSYGGDGAPVKEGPFVILVWNGGLTESEARTILTALGINSTDSNDVTVYVRDDRWNWVRKNGTAIYRGVGEDARNRPLRFVSLEIMVRDLEDAS